MTIDLDGCVVSEAVYSPGLRQARHAHDHSNVTVVTSGRIDEATERGDYRAHPSSVVLKAAGVEHDDRIGGFGAETLTIRFAHDSNFGRLVPAGAWSWFESPQVVRLALGLQSAFAAGRANDVERNAIALIETATASRDSRDSSPAWIAKIRAILDERFDEHIDFASLARDFALHPVYASRAFRRHTGVSLTDYVRDLRIRHARRELSQSRRAIGAIAATSGFADSSHLCRTFTSMLGLTPRAYRRLTSR